MDEKQNELAELNQRVASLTKQVELVITNSLRDYPDRVTELFFETRSLQWRVHRLEAATSASYLKEIHEQVAKLADHLCNLSAELWRVADKPAEEAQRFSEDSRTLYDDAGEWSRHYSNVRMTVATFVITSCVAIVTLGTDRGVPSPEVIKAVSALWFLGLFIFYAFTYLTFKERNRQLRHRKALSPATTNRANLKKKDREKYARIILDPASWALLFLNIAFGGYVSSQAKAVTGFLSNFRLGFIISLLSTPILPLMLFADWYIRKKNKQQLDSEFARMQGR